MNRPITEDVTPITDSFSRWAKRVQADASASPKALYAEGATAEQPYYFSKPCLGACCGLLMAVDTYHQVIPCRKELLRNKDFKALGEGSAADWEGISKWLVRRAGTHAQHPTYHRAGDPPQVITCNIGERLRLACCSSEVAVLMLRLAVRTACLAGSLYGPWESREALLQLIGANAWSSLLGALDALLGTFGADLDKQYNALNIVSDILHIFYSLSEWHTHVDFMPSDFGERLSDTLRLTMSLMLEHTPHLPRMRRQQASMADTALLMVPSMAMLIVKSRATKAELTCYYQFFRTSKCIGRVLAASMSGIADGRLQAYLEDMPELVETGCIERASCLLLYLNIVKHDLISDDNHLTVPWRTFCRLVPMHRVGSLIDQWLLSSGDAMFGLSSTHAAHTLVLALRLMRLISCGCKRPTFPLHSGMLLRWVHLLRHILAACPVTRAVWRAQGARGAGAWKLFRAPAEPARLPYAPEAGWHFMLWKALAEGVTSITDFLGHAFRPDGVPLEEHHVTAYPEMCVGTLPLPLYQEEVAGRVRWMCYVKQLGAMLDTGAAGVVEMLLRTTARNPCLNEDAAMLAQAPLLAHAMLHHPRAWPRQETALGLLISLRKFYQAVRTNPPYKSSNSNSATIPMALLTAIARKEAQLPEHTAALAATLLLPIILEATENYLETTDGQHASLKICREMLTMCSYLATSSAWPVLRGQRLLLTLAATMVLLTATDGIPKCGEPSPTPMLDLACMHAAACDLAIADEGFKASSVPGTGMMPALLRLYQLAQQERPRGSDAEGLLLLMDLQFSRVMAADISGIAAQQYFKQFLTSLESGLGSLPDWRRTAFWRQSSFLQAWSRAKKASRRPEAVSTADLPHQYRAEATWGRQPLLAPLARDKAASQQLEARSLLLAGQAGLCCNPQCTELSGGHERSLRTLRCGGGCQHGRFCSRKCQKQAWPVHRLVCKKRSKAH